VQKYLHILKIYTTFAPQIKSTFVFDNETILHQYNKGAKRANYKGNIPF
jgi:hypothetical protein